MMDASKYNLRCNRNISEKMTKKDFIYDIPTLMQSVRKLEMQKRPFVFSVPLRRGQNVVTKISQCTVIPEKMRRGGDANVIADRRILEYECNYCHESIATFLSLTTHVKFHCQRYCKTCYWILRENETMEQHIVNYHGIKSDVIDRHY